MTITLEIPNLVLWLFAIVGGITILWTAYKVVAFARDWRKGF